ncbi:MAG: hypothetical protein ACYCZK_07710 [Microbacteriaceae bacterium]
MLANTLKFGRAHTLGVLFGGLLVLIVSAWAVARIIELGSVDVRISGPILTVLGSSVTLGFVLLPLIFGIDDLLDPRKFALLGIPSRRLADGLAVSTLIGVPAFVLIALAVAQTISWSATPGAALLAAFSAVAIVAGCLLGARVATSLAAFLLSSRLGRELAGAVTVGGVILLFPVFSYLASFNWSRDASGLLTRVAAVVGWTPLGAAWAAPAAAAAGDVGSALAKAAIAAGSAGLLWLAWRALVKAMLAMPTGQSQRLRYSGLGWFGRVPAKPVGVIAARSLTYWGRDSRYRVWLVVIPIVPLLWIAPLLVVGVPWSVIVLIPVPVMCLFTAWMTHNDLAYDNTAFWLHVASNTSGWADRIGRIIPSLLIGVPLVLLGSVVSAWLHGDWSVLPPLLGLSSCILLSGLGVSSIASARFPYPAPRPGDSPFQQPVSIGTSPALIQSLSFFATVLLALPVLVLGAMGIFLDSTWNLTALWAGLVLGVLVLSAGLALGARTIRRRSPELLDFALRN